MMLLQLALFAQIAAFPGAVGGGAQSVGGRGGVILEVTNLNDSGPGSLRAAIQPAVCQPRVVIFRISGLIPAKSRLAITCPFITIAGQTAPGGPVTLGGPQQLGEQLDIQTHDVIIRFLSCDGNSPSPTGPDTGTVCFEEANGGGDVYNVIIDQWTNRHIGNKSLLYANDSSNKQHIKNSTWSHGLMYEPNVGHPVGPLMSAITNPIADVNNDWYYNLFVNMGHRLPLIAPMENTSLVNNVYYNWNYFGVNHDGSHLDAIGNNFIPGNLNSGNSNPHPFNATLGTGGGAGNCLTNCNLPGTPSDYLSGNLCQFGKDYDCAAMEAGDDPEGFPETGPYPASWRRSMPLPAEPIPMIAQDANTVTANIAATAGNSQNLDCNGIFHLRRDADDARVIAQFIARGPGGQFMGPGYLGSSTIAPIAPGTPCDEDPVNHLPLAYEKLMNITAGTPPWTPTSTGYSIFENYLNGTSAPPVPPPATWPVGTAVITIQQANAWPAVDPVKGVTPPATVVPSGTTGVTTGAPVTSSGGTFYPIKYSNGVTGYTGTTFLQQTTPPPTPSAVSVNCAPSTIPSTGTSSCSATVAPTGAPQTVVWSATNGAMSNGVFTPATGATSGMVKAASSVVPTVTGQAPITINPAQPAPTVTCTPSSVSIGGTAQCSANQAITSWTASAGSITSAGVFTAPSTAQTVTITGSNANGSGTAPVTVTSVTPPPVCAPLKITINIGGQDVAVVTCTPNANGQGYTCTTP
jgi:pectate lyase